MMTFNRCSIACAMLALLVTGAKAGDSTSKGDAPPPPPADGSQPPPPPGHGHGRRPPPSADMFFKRFDANKDGVVTYDEFVKGHANPPPPPPPPADSNGKDSPPPPPPPMTEDQLKERFNSLDANGDGQITRDEYEAAIKRRPPPPAGQGPKRKLSDQ